MGRGRSLTEHTTDPSHTALLRHAHRVFDEYEGREHRAGPPPTGSRPRPRRGRRRWPRVLARQGALLDRSTISLAERVFIAGEIGAFDGELRDSLERDRERWGDPALIRDPARFFRDPQDPVHVRARRVARLPGGRKLRVAFPSTYRTFDPAFQQRYDAYERNRTARVTLFKHDGRGWPAVLCIHPFGCGYASLDERMFEARRLYDAGYDVALPALPFHGRRTPEQVRFSGQLFPGRDIQLTNEGFGQTHADLTVLMRWMREEHGASSVGLVGVSLGGYVAALLATLDASLAFAVTIVAPTSFADIMWHHGNGRAGRLEALDVELTRDDLRAMMAVHSPVTRPVRLPRERLLMIWGEGDRIVPGVHQLALWEHWGRPETRRFPGGHVLQFGRSRYLRETREWIARLT